MKRTPATRAGLLLVPASLSLVVLWALGVGDSVGPAPFIIWLHAGSATLASAAVNRDLLFGRASANQPPPEA